MAMNIHYAEVEPARAEINKLEGATMIEFGAPWCGHCRAVQSLLASALTIHPRVRHIKIEDGKGQPLGRSFRITLWPTLVFIKHGIEVTRLVRPTDENDVHQALEKIDNEEK